MHAAVVAGDLPGLQAAVVALQHPEQELDTLLTLEGEAVAMAPMHRAATGGKETCLKVGRAVGCAPNFMAEILLSLPLFHLIDP